MQESAPYDFKRACKVQVSSPHNFQEAARCKKVYHIISKRACKVQESITHHFKSPCKVQESVSYCVPYHFKKVC